MTDIYNSTDNLYWVFTYYGKQRLTSLEADDTLQLYSMKIGDYNWYKDPDSKLGGTYSESAFLKYYETSTNTELGSEIANASFSINSKSVDEDSLTVTLSTTISEEYGGFDIREVGIYEQDTTGTARLFAVCTMQPLPKPSTSTNHYIAIQLNANLQSRNLAEKYEQIVLDPDNNFATVDELTALQENLLFVEANLAQQISNNSNIIGLNRAQQLAEQIINDKKKYASFAASTTYANFLNATSLSNIQAFWVFNHTNDLSRDLSVADLSSYGNYLATDSISTTYEQGYCGLCSWMKFDNRQYYMLYDDIDFSLITEDEDGNVSDSPFSFFFVGAQNTNEHDCTLLAKYNEYTRHPGFTIKILTTRQLEITLYTNDECYIRFTTSEGSIPKAGEFYVLSATYNADVEQNPRLEVMVDATPVSTSISYSTNDSGNTVAYTGMTLAGSKLPLMSFIRTTSGDSDFVDSQMSIMALVKDELTTEYVRATSFSMMALIGKDPCLI